MGNGVFIEIEKRGRNLGGGSLVLENTFTFHYKFGSRKLFSVYFDTSSFITWWYLNSKKLFLISLSRSDLL